MDGSEPLSCGIATVAPNTDAVARTLGLSPFAMLWRVHLPILRPSVLTAALIVFVDVMKELPATLLLRPFNYNTLATRVYEKASLEQIGQAAPAAMLVIAVGLAAASLDPGEAETVLTSGTHAAQTRPTRSNAPFTLQETVHDEGTGRPGTAYHECSHGRHS